MRGARLTSVLRQLVPVLLPSVSSSPTSSSERKQRLIIVTGGAQGIGRALTLAFAKAGDKVACIDVDTAAGDSVMGADSNVKFICADVSSASQCRQAVKDAVAWAGPSHRQVDVLVNNVGVQSDNGMPTHLLPEAIWDRVLNINLKSYFLMSQSVLPAMLQSGSGVILNISSVQGYQSQVGIPAYAASKGGVLSLTRQMSMDYARRGLRVLSVSPGSVHTPLVQRNVEQDGSSIEALGLRNPRGKVASPDELTALCLFLTSSAAANMTGCDVVCDGGLMAMGSWDHRMTYADETSHAT
jgi:NAD(P)-dependent dehydrogenase (short-subunit alcohol dehydrogenase family)